MQKVAQRESLIIEVTQVCQAGKNLTASKLQSLVGDLFYGHYFPCNELIIPCGHFSFT